MEEQKDTTGTGTFISGFLFGILTGLLFTTRKGRQIMRSVMRGEVTKFSELEGFLERKMEAEEETHLIGDTATSVPKEKIVDAYEVKEETLTPVLEKKPKAKVPPRRFFKRKK